jgi:hypothetical protein
MGKVDGERAISQESWFGACLPHHKIKVKIKVKIKAKINRNRNPRVKRSVNNQIKSNQLDSTHSAQ